jgi:hypothetical protein
MEDVLAIIERVIQEHKVILSEFKELETISNDSLALEAIKQSKEAFMPGRLSPRQGLHKMNEIRDKLEEGLEKHFSMEETKLLEAFEKYADKSLVKALQTLLTQHSEIRVHLNELKELISELLPEELSRHLWESKAYDMRAHATNIHNLLDAHAREEKRILDQLRKELTAKQENV